jgi:hypothetical protein
MAFRFSLWLFGIFFQIWYVWTKKNLATLVSTRVFETSLQTTIFLRPVTIFTQFNKQHMPNFTLLGMFSLKYYPTPWRYSNFFELMFLK